MEKHVRLGLLLDIYGELLTERQRSILFQSVNEDCSLAEIAEREGVSRQAVRDAIIKALTRDRDEQRRKLREAMRHDEEAGDWGATPLPPAVLGLFR